MCSTYRMPIARPKQFPSGFLVAALLAASGLLWAAMFFGPLAQLERLASDLMPFDIRPRGYTYAEARAFLEAIGQQGRRYYVSPELIIDTVYSPPCGLAWAALWWLTMPGRVREAASTRKPVRQSPIFITNLAGSRLPLGFFCVRGAQAVGRERTGNDFGAHQSRPRRC